MPQLDRPIIYSHTATSNALTLSVERDPHAIALRVRYATETTRLESATARNYPAHTNIEIQNLPPDTGLVLQVQAVGDASSYTDSNWSAAIFAATAADEGPPDSKAARLRSVRRRIAILREALECPDSLVNVSVDGVSETWVARKDLVEELNSLEIVEARLAGRNGRIRQIDLSRT